jgi:hypothetical protein
MDTPPIEHGPGATPRNAGNRVGRFIVRVTKLTTIAIVGVVVLGFGIAWLVDGLSSHQVLPTVAGAVAIGCVVTGFVYTLRRSSREANAAIAATAAKLQAGLRTCWKCKMDFEEATAPRTPKPWHHTAIAIAFSLVPIIFGGLVLWALHFSGVGFGGRVHSLDYSIKALFILLIGTGFLFQAIKDARRLYVRCPKCGRACGSIDAAKRGFAVEPNEKRPNEL